MGSRWGFNGGGLLSLQPCNESRKALFGFPAPLSVNEGQLTSTSGTSAAHLRDGYRGYRPEAPSACIIGGVCIQKKRGVGGGYSLEGAAVLRAGLCTSGTASWGVTTLYPKLVHHCKTHIVHIMVLLDQRNWGLMFVASFVFVYTMFWEDFSTLPNRLELKHLVSFSHLLSCQTFWGFHFPWSGFLPAFWKPGLSWPPVRQG